MAEQQPPPPDDRAAELAALLGGYAAASTGAAATGAATGAAVGSLAAVLAALTRLMLSWGWRRLTIRHTLRVTTTILTEYAAPPAGPGVTPALDGAVRDELRFSAWYLERFATRMQAALDAAAAAGEPLDQAADEQAERERQWGDAHRRAQDGRRTAAEAVDAEAAKPGTLEVTDDPPAGDTTAPRPRRIVSWVTVNDDRATPECVAADGCWFYADTPPLIGYPGQPHGATCRCTPGRATRRMFLHGRHVDEATAGLLDHRAHPGARPGRPTGPDQAA